MSRAMELCVSDFGSFVGKKSERVVVRRKSATVAEVPLRSLDRVLVVGRGVAVSGDVVEECATRGIEIFFLSSTGKPYALLSSPTLTGTIITRREQFEAVNDARGTAAAMAFVEGKLRNQANTLKYFSKYRRTVQPETYRALQDAAAAILSLVDQIDLLMETVPSEMDGASAGPSSGALTGAPTPATVDDLRQALMGLEARAARAYWEGVGLILEGKATFVSREHRGAGDQVNAMLNYGYGILYSEAWSAVLLAGLEPFAGFLHTDRPGKPSLVLDFVEEFRSAIVDRAVISLLSKKKGSQAGGEGGDTAGGEAGDPGAQAEAGAGVGAEGEGKAGAGAGETQQDAGQGQERRQAQRQGQGEGEGEGEGRSKGDVIERQFELDRATRKLVVARVLERMDSGERYESKEHKLRTIMHLQARRLAAFLRGEAIYKPFTASW